MNKSCSSSTDRYEPYIDRPRTELRRTDAERLTPHQLLVPSAHLVAVHEAAKLSNTTNCTRQRVGGEWNATQLELLLYCTHPPNLK